MVRLAHRAPRDRCLTAPALLPPVATGADAAGRNVRLLSQLRMLAIGGQLATILFVAGVLRVALPIVPMLTALAALLALNLAIAAAARRQAIGATALFATMLADVACLTVQLYLAGGLGNPFVLLYLLQVVIAAVLLPRWAGWTLAALTTGLLAWLARSPNRLPAGYGAELSMPYEAGAWIGYGLAAMLLVLFVGRIVRNLAERDAHLAAMRQRSADEEHVVRIGLLASGAAHELGTPLASLAVMLGDWRRDPAVAATPDLLADVEAMAGEIARCKTILGQVLLAAGEVRGDAPARTSLRRFVVETARRWEDDRGGALVTVEGPANDRAIVADRPLAQTIANLLDNAVEADANRVTAAISIEADCVVLAVRDDGRGFPPAMLATIGDPYRTTKKRHGGGLGLFLASNVLRTLGGTMEARNRSGGGAEVTLRWPVDALAVAP